MLKYGWEPTTLLISDRVDIEHLKEAILKKELMRLRALTSLSLDQLLVFKEGGVRPARCVHRGGSKLGLSNRQTIGKSYWRSKKGEKEEQQQQQQQQEEEEKVTH